MLIQRALRTGQCPQQHLVICLLYFHTQTSQTCQTLRETETETRNRLGVNLPSDTTNGNCCSAMHGLSVLQAYV